MTPNELRHETIRLEPKDGPLDLHLVRWDPPATSTTPATSATSHPPWLLVHGLSSNARLWDGVGERLAVAGHSVVAVDLRGHGLSGAPSGGFDVPSVAEDLSLLIEALGWPEVAVAGQSWGGNVALELAASHVGQVHTLVGIDGGTIRLADQWPEWSDCLEAKTPPPLAGLPLARIQKWLDTSAADWPESGRQGTLHGFEITMGSDGEATVSPRLTLENHLTILRHLWEHDPRERYEHVHAPTLLIGAVDHPSPEADADKFAAITAAAHAIPTSRVVWFAPAHHDVHAQKPDEVAALLHDAVTQRDFFGRPRNQRV